MDLAQDYFALFGLPRRFALDPEALAARYRELARATHPDRYAAAADAERRYAVQLAARVNEAYRTLKDPLERARYLLALDGADGEHPTTCDTAFLMRQMELREALAEARDTPDPCAALADLEREIRAEAAAITASLASELEAGEREAALVSVTKLQFYRKLEQEAAALEAELEDE